MLRVRLSKLEIGRADGPACRNNSNLFGAESLSLWITSAQQRCVVSISDRSLQVRSSYGSERGNGASAACIRQFIKGLKKLSVSEIRSKCTDINSHDAPYLELTLNRQLHGGHSSSLDSRECIPSDDYIRREGEWTPYVMSNQATGRKLGVLSAPRRPFIQREDDCRMAQRSIILFDTDSTVKDFSAALNAAEIALREKESIIYSIRESSLSNWWKRVFGKRRMKSLVLLNFLAALYGSSTVAGKFAADAAPALPASMSTMVRFCSAVMFFLPTLKTVIKSSDVPVLKGGVELGGLLFAATILETLGNGGASSDAPLLFAFTVIFVPIMELCAGRQSVRKTTRLASLVALSGMGLLEEEGFGWKGISLPQIGDLWGLAASAIYGVHIFRAEGHSTRVDPLSLTAVQCGTLAALSILWEACRLSQNPSTNCRQYLMQLQSLPWCPLVYSGLVCAGLCSWLELRGLRSVPASTVTMINTTIPIWGAFLSFLLRGDVPGESAVLGGSVILCASLFAQIATKQDNLNAPKITCKVQTFEYGSLSGRSSETSKSRGYDHIKEPRGNAGSTAKRFTPADHVQGAIISSQLKFPYYAAQVKKLLADVKLKLASAKSAVVSLHAFVSTSSIVSNQSQPAAGTAVHASTTASSAISAAASVHQAVNNVVAGASISASTPTAQVPLQVITSGVPQIPHASTYMQSAPQWLDSMVVALINSLGTATTGLECTAIALGSDVMQAVEHAEGIVNLAENLLQQIAEHSLYAAASLASTVTFQALQMTSSLTANNLPSLLQFYVAASLADESTLGVNSLDSVIPLLLYHSHLVEQPSFKLLANLSNIYHS